ncbi:hypothetical protein GCM10010406_13620 [Streptomyces thermolineatus]|uniref:Uncharacterized protein n=1 Tax=Streptomyces thermolineatus TaxID=44033 RepID=A0ABP5YG93_9ACTN
MGVELGVVPRDLQVGDDQLVLQRTADPHHAADGELVEGRGAAVAPVGRRGAVDGGRAAALLHGPLRRTGTVRLRRHALRPVGVLRLLPVAALLLVLRVLPLLLVLSLLLVLLARLVLLVLSLLLVLLVLVLVGLRGDPEVLRLVRPGVALAAAPERLGRCLLGRPGPVGRLCLRGNPSPVRVSRLRLPGRRAEGEPRPVGGVAQADVRPRADFRLQDLLPPYVRAVRASVVLEDPRTPVEADRRVAPRDPRIVEHEVRLRVAAEREGPGRVKCPGLSVQFDYEFRHSMPHKVVPRVIPHGEGV